MPCDDDADRQGQRPRDWEHRVRAALADLAKAVTAAPLGIEEVSAQVLRHALELTGSAHGCVSELDSTTGHNVVHALTHAEFQQCWLSRGADGRFVGLRGHCLNTRAPFFANDPACHPASIGAPSGNERIENFLSVPVLLDGEPVGQISGANREGDYQDHHLEAVEQLAHLYALVLRQRQADGDRRHLEEQLRQSQKMEAVGTLAGGIAHDFNNILAIISYNAELAFHDELAEDSPARYSVSQIIEACGRARDLIQQVMAFSRPEESGKRLLQLGWLVKDTLRLLRATIPSTIEFAQNLTTRQDGVLGNPTQLSQVVVNLCTNAAYAMRENGGTLSVDLAPEELDGARAKALGIAPGFYQRLSVADSGHGMPPEVLSRVFEPYFTTKPKGEGAGLGLAVVHGIVSAHGGSITARSAPGEGTVFAVRLPAVTEGDRLLEEDRAGRAVLVRRGRVLFVDDEEAIRLVAGRLLESLGCRVETAKGGAEALELLRAKPDGFDVVITDYAMPHMTGFDLADELHRLRPDLPVLLCTGFREAIGRDKARTGAIREMLFKPIRTATLVAALNRAFGEGGRDEGD